MTTEHPLGALISQVKKANGWSDQAVADRAVARGHDISKSNIARIRTEPVTTIVGKQMFALEAGLGIPVRQLAQAALHSMGILDFPASQVDAEPAIMADPTLPQHIRDTLLTIIRTERQSRRAANVTPLDPSASTRAPRTSTREKTDAADRRDNVHAFTRRNQPAQPDDSPPEITEADAARTEDDYITSGKRDEGDDE